LIASRCSNADGVLRWFLSPERHFISIDFPKTALPEAKQTNRSIKIMPQQIKETFNHPLLRCAEEEEVTGQLNFNAGDFPCKTQFGF